MARPHDMTSEPRWPTEAGPVDRTGHSLVIAAAGDPVARAAAARWRRDALAAGVTVTEVGGGLAPAGADADAVRADDEAVRIAERLSIALDGATAATRLAVAGSEALLGRVTAAALRAGLRPTEIAGVRTVTGPRLVRCTHCRTLTPTTAEVGERQACQGCGVPLEVFHHYSPRIGAYMGFHADAEELGADDAAAHERSVPERELAA